MQKLTEKEEYWSLPLTQYQLVEIEGFDAEKYLQGQLTCDVTALNIGEHILTAHCDPAGKISALMRLYRAGSQKFFAIIHKDLLPEALTQLKKYAVFSKVGFTELNTPLFGSTGNHNTLSEHTTVLELPTDQKRAIIWGEELAINGESELWDLMDIQDGMPILLKANQFTLIPQAMNLQAVEKAISFTKGCYIGQETVARAKYRRANKRAMFTLAGKYKGGLVLPEIASSIEMQLGENWRATGTILSAESYDHTLWVQVVMNKEVDVNSKFRVSGVELEIVALPYELPE